VTSAPEPGLPAGPARGRNESPEQRLDRNWGELVQELRVMQAGTQILTGFLLTLPFQPRFAHLDALQRGVYLATMVVAACATALLLAPVSLHRLLFARGQKRALVHIGDRLVRVSLAAVGVVVTGVVLLVVDVVAGRAAGVVTASGVLALTVVTWLGLPWWVRRDPERWRV